MRHGKARSASELVTYWNPNEPNQFFWVDDAFGAVRHEEQLTRSGPEAWITSSPPSATVPGSC